MEFYKRMGKKSQTFFSSPMAFGVGLMGTWMTGNEVEMTLLITAQRGNWRGEYYVFAIALLDIGRHTGIF